MNREKTTFEDILKTKGQLIYKTKGVSMEPLLRQNRDLIKVETLEHIDGTSSGDAGNKPTSVVSSKAGEGKKMQCASHRRYEKNDVVLFKRDNGDYVLHRIIKVRENDYWIVGDNCIGGEYVREDQVLAKLTAVKRKNKEFSVSSPGYKVYVFFWGTLYPLRISVRRILHYGKQAVKKTFGA